MITYVLVLFTVLGAIQAYFCSRNPQEHILERKRKKCTSTFKILLW